MQEFHSDTASGLHHALISFRSFASTTDIYKYTYSNKAGQKVGENIVREQIGPKNQLLGLIIAGELQESKTSHETSPKSVKDRLNCN